MVTHTIPWHGLGVSTVHELFLADSLHVGTRFNGVAAREHPSHPSWSQDQGPGDV